MGPRLMHLKDRSLTAMQAAQRFAEQCFHPPRKVGRWDGRSFQLDQGVKWYKVCLTGEGWEIEEA